MILEGLHQRIGVSLIKRRTNIDGNLSGSGVGHVMFLGRWKLQRFECPTSRSGVSSRRTKTVAAVTVVREDGVADGRPHIQHVGGE